MRDPPKPVEDTETPAPPCEVPLRIVSYGDTERYFVDVEIGGEPSVWQLDTGSGTTFRFQGSTAPAYSEDVGRLSTRCGDFPFAGRGLEAGSAGPDGALIAGLIGMDYLLDQDVVLDTAGRRLLHHDGPPNLEGAVRVPIDVIQSHALVPLSLDGVALRLMFDTGGGHTLWVGQEGRPTDRVEQVQDAEGTVFDIYVGTGELLLGPLERTIPVARAVSFPYFEDTVAALGGDLHGLLGVTAFPDEELYFDGSALELAILIGD